MKIDLAGLPIAITGAGTGIGRATAVACAGAGMPVAISGRREDPLREVEAQILRAGGRVLVLPTDVADPEACAGFIGATVETFGDVYAVFANAGYGLRGAVHELPDGAIRRIFETNFWGSMHVIRPALAHMLGRPGDRTPRGHILMCSSCLSKLGTPFTAPYSASKALQDHFGRGMRHELAPLGVHVSTVHPIGTRTEFFDAAAAREDSRGAGARPPGMFTQPAERVAEAVVACLRRPRGEVWTSRTVRFAMAAAVAFPGVCDWLLSRKFGGRDGGQGDSGS